MCGIRKKTWEKIKTADTSGNFSGFLLGVFFVMKSLCIFWGRPPITSTSPRKKR